MDQFEHLDYYSNERGRVRTPSLAFHPCSCPGNHERLFLSQTQKIYNIEGSFCILINPPSVLRIVMVINGFYFYCRLNITESEGLRYFLTYLNNIFSVCDQTASALAFTEKQTRYK